MKKSLDKSIVGGVRVAFLTKKFSSYFFVTFQPLWKKLGHDSKIVRSVGCADKLVCQANFIRASKIEKGWSVVFRGMAVRNWNMSIENRNRGGMKYY